MRINIELRRDANANVVLNRLFKHTQLQDTYGVIMLALVGTEPTRMQPKVMNILEILQHYIRHQEDVVTRRTKYDLNKAEERAHIYRDCSLPLTISMRSLRSSAVPPILRRRKRLDGALCSL